MILIFVLKIREKIGLNYLFLGLMFLCTEFILEGIPKGYQLKVKIFDYVRYNVSSFIGPQCITLTT